jgi:hypothetical protein
MVARSAELMRAVDPKLTLLAAATSSRDWTLPLLKAAGKQLDYVAIHEYWLPCWGENLTPDYLACVMCSGQRSPGSTRATKSTITPPCARRGSTPPTG